MKWIEYDKNSGRIMQSIFGSSVVMPSETDSKGYIPDITADGASHYVYLNSQSLFDRPETSISAVQNEGIVNLTGVAFGTAVSIMGQLNSQITQDATDGNLQLIFTDPGAYIVTAEQFPEKVFSAMFSVSA